MSHQPGAPDGGSSGPIVIVAVIAIAVILVVVLHLTGVVGPGAH